VTTATDPAQDAAIRITLEEEIARRWADRRWYRTTARVLFEDRWWDLEADNARVLRGLVTMLRHARRLARC